jgi:hypothetical protein
MPQDDNPIEPIEPTTPPADTVVEPEVPPRIVDMTQIFTTFNPDGLLEQLRSLDVNNTYSDKIVKLVRNQLLNHTDWTQTVDAPLAPEVKQTFAEYRQELRDITTHPDYPDNVTLPPMPSTK